MGLVSVPQAVGYVKHPMVPSRKLSRTVSRARLPGGLSVEQFGEQSLGAEISRLKGSGGAGGLTATTVTPSMVRSTVPTPRMPENPVEWTVIPRITTGSEVVISMPIVGTPGGSTITGPLSPATASRV